MYKSFSIATVEVLSQFRLLVKSRIENLGNLRLADLFILKHFVYRLQKSLPQFKHGSLLEFLKVSGFLAQNIVSSLVSKSWS
jgi:hypothetical protein